MPFSCKDDVTYEAFGIDPAAFYATKFSFGSGFNPAAVTPAFELQIGFDKFRLLEKAIEAALQHNETLRCLDYGCGSGLYGRWIKHRFGQSVHLVGIDMSARCAADALDTGYDECLAHDFLAGLPFSTGAFDFVWSMDVFGHIEFRHKAAAIAELHRVTRNGGHHFHGIETADVPYLSSIADNASDGIRQYVWIDGHVGVETLDEVVERFSNLFEVEAAYPWILKPFLDVSNAIDNRQWPDDQIALMEVDTPDGRLLTNAVTQRYNSFFRDAISGSVGAVQTLQNIRQKLGCGPLADFVLSVCEGSGFSIVQLRKN